MAQTTEAACLLQSGSMFSRRIGLKTATGEDLFAGVKPGGVSIYFGDAPIYHFDLDGRWQRAFVDGVHYLKGLDATVRSIDREREAGALVLRRQTLPLAQTADLDDSIRSVALDLIDDLDSGRLEVLRVPPGARAFESEDFRTFLERVARWDHAAWFAHRERYLSTYGPIPFLPPDCTNSLVLQATLGHVGGQAFGRGSPAEHHVRSFDEFCEHCRTVSKLVGRRVAQYRGVFLGGADLLRQPIKEVVEVLGAIARYFPIGDARSQTGATWDDFGPDLGQVHMFLDDFGPPLPDSEGWRRLKASNLGRVTLGVESGDSEIRASFGKSWETNDLQGVIADLKAAGVGVGLVVLVGAGGRSVADRHLAKTAGLLGSLPLQAGDLVSLVDARSLDDSRQDFLEPLSDDETSAQVSALKALSAARWPSKGPKLIPYNPAKQWT